MSALVDEELLQYCMSHHFVFPVVQTKTIETEGSICSESLWEQRCDAPQLHAGSTSCHHVTSALFLPVLVVLLYHRQIKQTVKGEKYTENSLG